MTGKVYCAGAIRGNLEYNQFSKKIVEIVASLDFTPLHETTANSHDLTDKEIYSRDISWLESSDVVVAEVSGVSMGVGFEIAYALYKLKIPVLALVNKKVERISAMIEGCDSGLLKIARYKDEVEMEKIIQEFVYEHSFSRLT